MDLIARYENLYSAVVGDALDELGRRHQALAPGFARLGAEGSIAGYAATLRVEAVDQVPDVPYTVQFAAVDALRRAEVMVVAGAADVGSAFWGELISTRALAQGCHGAIVDGYARDVDAIRRHGFALWARGTHPADSAGRLEAVEAGRRGRCGGVTVNPGDVVVADLDGVLIVPRALAEDVAARAEAKAAKEDVVREQLHAGRGVQETYDEHGVM